MLCPQCGKPTQESFAALCEGCQAEKDRLKAEQMAAQAAAMSQKRPPRKVSNARATGGDDFGPAGFWLRVLATLLDSAILNMAAAIFLVVAFAVGLSDTVLYQLNGSERAITGVSVIFLLPILIVLVVNLLYYPLMESSPWQATIGKRLLGLRVSHEEGGVASFWQCVARMIIRFLSFLIFCLPFLVVAFSGNKRGIHDSVTSTKVMKTEGTTWTRIWSALALLIVLYSIGGVLESNDSTNPRSIIKNSTDTAVTAIDNAEKSTYSAQGELGTYTLTKLQRVVLKVKATAPMAISYKLPNDPLGQSCADSCPLLKIIASNGATIDVSAKPLEQKIATPVEGEIQIEVQNQQHENIELVLLGLSAN